MERITVDISVVCPIHQQIIGYMEARHWYLVGRLTNKDNSTYSRWQKYDQHCFIDIYESPERVDYYLRQKDAIVLLADYDHWLDEYSLVEQLLKGGIMGQDSEVKQPYKLKVSFSDRGVSHNSLPVKPGRF